MAFESVFFVCSELYNPLSPVGLPLSSSTLYTRVRRYPYLIAYKHIIVEHFIWDILT